tara:strand:- start:1668 stop:2138 length:471 start_codon:yes stop_codon:yes gene_type:complete
MKINFLKCLIILSVIYSCKSASNEYYSFPKSTWDSKKIIQFDITTKDSLQQQTTNISIRHNTSYKYQNIIFLLHHSFKEKAMSIDTIELLLAQDDGRWIGTGKGNIREFSTTVLPNKTYQNGLHTFSLELAMRDNTSIELEKLQGISDISLQLSNK